MRNGGFGNSWSTRHSDYSHVRHDTWSIMLHSVTSQNWYGSLEGTRLFHVQQINHEVVKTCLQLIIGKSLDLKPTRGSEFGIIAS